MADTNELARARDALTTPSGAPDVAVLGAVRDGLLSVPTDPPTLRPSRDDDAPRLAVRRRTAL